MPQLSRRRAAAVRRHRRVPERRAAQGHPPRDQVRHARRRDAVRVPARGRLLEGAARRLRDAASRRRGPATSCAACATSTRASSTACSPACSTSGVAMVTGGRDLLLRDRAAGPRRATSACASCASVHPNGKPAPCKSDGTLTFDKLADVYLSGTHARRGPAGAPGRGRHQRVRDALPRRVRQPLPALLPGERCTRWCRTKRSRGALKLQINASNCVHCKTCDIADPVPDHHLGHARGRRRSGLQELCEPQPVSADRMHESSRMTPRRDRAARDRPALALPAAGARRARSRAPQPPHRCRPRAPALPPRVPAVLRRARRTTATGC